MNAEKGVQELKQNKGGVVLKKRRRIGPENGLQARLGLRDWQWAV